MTEKADDTGEGAHMGKGKVRYVTEDVINEVLAGFSETVLKPYIEQTAQEAVDKALEGYTGRLQEGGDVYKKLLGAATAAAQAAAGRAVDSITKRVGIGSGKGGKGKGRGNGGSEDRNYTDSDGIEKLRKELEEDGSIYTALLKAVEQKYGEDIRSAVEEGLGKGGYIRDAITDIVGEVVERKLKQYDLDSSEKSKGRKGQGVQTSEQPIDSVPEKGTEAYREFMDEVRQAGREGAEEALSDLLREGSLGDGRVEIKAEDGQNKKLRLGTVLNDLIGKAAGSSKIVDSVLTFLGYKKGHRKGLEPKDILSGFNNVVEMAEELRRLKKELENLPSGSSDSGASEKLEELGAKVEQLEKRLTDETDERKKKLGELKSEFDFLTRELEKIGEEGQVFEERDK